MHITIFISPIYAIYAPACTRFCQQEFSFFGFICSAGKHTHIPPVHVLFGVCGPALKTLGAFPNFMYHTEIEALPRWQTNRKQYTLNSYGVDV